MRLFCFREPSVPPIYTMAVVKGQVIFSKKFSTTVEIWDLHKDRKQRSFSVEQMFGYEISIHVCFFL